MHSAFNPRMGGRRPKGKIAFDYTGADQPLVVPAGVTRMRFKMWGASGANQNDGGHSGAGGFTDCVIRVYPGETLMIVVGQRGVFTPSGGAATLGYGGGGIGNPGPTAGATSSNGGGRAAVRRGGVDLASAGGGGGGQWISTGAGAGGGVAGEQGEHNGTHPGGGAGTQDAGGLASGTAGSTDGSALQGGQGQPAGTKQGSGGGGGKFGGGGGGECNAGGGSGSLDGALSGITIAGVGPTTPAVDDEDYAATAGQGVTTAATHGNHARVVAIWG